MKYFIDTEFIEGFHKPLFGKRRHFIDLISIGIVCEDGRTYSAISNEYKYKDADKWVQDNVIDPLYISTVHGDGRNHCSSENFQYAYGKSNNQIAKEIKKFIDSETIEIIGSIGGIQFLSDKAKIVIRQGYTEPEFYGYYADYDWVLFCSLFGRMIDLPKGFPMYCKDLKQMLDEKAESKNWYYGRDIWNNTPNRSNDLQEGDYPASLKDKIKKIKSHDDYPKQNNEHNALADAKWNHDLYKFIKTL